MRALPDHPLLDRVVRGRAWIALLGVLLAGIVAMQVEVLKLSAATGRSLERGTALLSRNQQLRASVAELGDDQRIERLAAQMGMVMAAPTDVSFLSPNSPVTINRALGNIHAPDSSGFISNLPLTATASGAAASMTTADTTGTAVGTSGASTTNALATTSTPSTTSATPASTTGTSSATTNSTATGAGTPATGAGTPVTGGTQSTPATTGPTNSSGASGLTTGG